MSRSRPAHLTVLRSEEITPSMRRVVLGDGPTAAGFDQLAAGWTGCTDAYVKLVFLQPGVTYPEPLDLDVVRERMPHAAPTLRTYTVRRLDTAAREVWIDLVVHGDQGVAGPWAARVQPGDTIHARGPGGAYRPAADVDHHLLVGDEAALPAIAASLLALAPGSRATVFLEVAGPQEEQPLPSPGLVDVHWLHRDGAEPGTTTLLDDAVRAWEWPAGRVQAFVHGESALLRTVRPYVRQDRAVDRADLSVSAYWRRGETEEGFRRWKSTQDDAVIRPGG